MSIDQRLATDRQRIEHEQDAADDVAEEDVLEEYNISLDERRDPIEQTHGVAGDY